MRAKSSLSSSMPFVALVLAVLGGLAHADSVKGFTLYAAGIAGWVIPSESDFQSRLGYGGELGFHLNNGFGLGAYFIGSSKDVTTGALTVPTKIQSYGGELNYFVDFANLIFRLGARAGGSVFETDVLGTAVTAHPFSAGPVASLDFKLGPFLSVGAEASYLFFWKADTNIGVQTDSFQTLNGMGSLKLWF